MKSRMTIALTSMILALGIIVSGYMVTNRDNISQASTMPKDSLINNDTIIVQGEGVVKQAPDIAYISIGVQTKNAKVEAAQSENAKKFNNVVKEIEKQGIQKKDIQTVDYSVNPNYNDNGKITGYTVTNTVSVTIRDISKIGKIIDAVTDQDANVINGIRFSIDNKSKAYNEALKLAISDAKTKANTIGDSIGNVSIQLTSVKEQQPNSDVVYYGAENAKMAADSVATSISGGELEVKANVTVVYKIK